MDENQILILLNVFITANDGNYTIKETGFEIIKESEKFYTIKTDSFINPEKVVRKDRLKVIDSNTKNWRIKYDEGTALKMLVSYYTFCFPEDVQECTQNIKERIRREHREYVRQLKIMNVEL